MSIIDTFLLEGSIPSTSTEDIGINKTATSSETGRSKSNATSRYSRASTVRQ